jgi:hypothetical protein
MPKSGICLPDGVGEVRILESLHALRGEVEFKPIVVSLLDNHYHTLGYFRYANGLAPLSRILQGSVAKLVNDQLEDRLLPFWKDDGRHSYFDGCIRDEKQFGAAYRYTYTQSRRHGLGVQPQEYPHTSVFVEMERALNRAEELKAFLPEVPYKRYSRRQ